MEIVLKQIAVVGMMDAMFVQLVTMDMYLALKNFVDTLNKVIVYP
tara:strand:- start:456 stop:590 length:135 start_codon:yes stop_codon:yes gene_type:complete